MLIGHQSALAQLAALLTSGRFPHALLIHGPQGIGKHTLATQLATRLICGPAVQEPSLLGPQPDSPATDILAPNTTAPAWHQLQANSCPDYHVLTPEDGKKSIGIKQVQSLLEVLLRTADTARTVIVDSLEDLTPEAANTLLKILEEPRPGIYFLLIAHQLSATLPTIRSRCRLLKLAPLTLEQTRQVLVGQGADASLAPLANGCPGSVLGPAAKARQAVLEALQSGQTPPNNPEFINTLLTYLSQQPPTLAVAETYFKLAALRRDQTDKNLPASLTNEAALRLISA
jgi:DNA polymerase-3 subunit delta'